MCPLAPYNLRCVVHFSKVSSVNLTARITHQQYHLELGWGIRNRGCANPGRIRANPFSLRVRANCESEPQVRPSRRPAGAKTTSIINNIKKPCESWSELRESVQCANPCDLRIPNPDLEPCPIQDHVCLSLPGDELRNESK